MTAHGDCLIRIHCAGWAERLYKLMVLFCAVAGLSAWKALASCPEGWWTAAIAVLFAGTLLAMVWSRGVRLWQLPQHDTRRDMHAFWLLPLSLALQGMASYALARQWAQHCAAPPDFLWVALPAAALSSIPGTLLCCAANLPAPPCPAAGHACWTSQQPHTCCFALHAAVIYLIALWHQTQYWALSAVVKGAVGATATLLFMVLVQPTIACLALLRYMAFAAVLSSACWDFLAPLVWVAIRLCLSSATRLYLENQSRRGILGGASASTTASRVAAPTSASRIAAPQPEQMQLLHPFRQLRIQ